MRNTSEVSDGPTTPRPTSNATPAIDHLWQEYLSEAAQQVALKSGLREEFTALPRGDLRRVAVAWAVYRRTSLRQSWIADRLGLRSGDNVSAQVRKLSTPPSEELSPEIQTWMKAFE